MGAPHVLVTIATSRDSDIAPYLYHYVRGEMGKSGHFDWE